MYLVVNNNQAQREIYFNSVASVSDALTDRYDNVAQYIQLSTVADSLARENARLLAEADNARFIKAIFRDSIREPEKGQLFVFQSAKIISNSINRSNNSITIDRGRNHGIKPSMGVIGADQKGVVGIIKRCTGNYSRLIPLLHRQTKISAAIQRNGYFGSIVWRGNDSRTVSMIDVPKHAQLEIGDTVQTSGYSTIFPPGIMLGTIDTFWRQPGSNFYEINVGLSMNFSSVKYVYVVENMHQEELNQLESAESDE